MGLPLFRLAPQPATCCVQDGWATAEVSDLSAVAWLARTWRSGGGDWLELLRMMIVLLVMNGS